MSHLLFLSGLGQRSNCGRHTQLPFDLFFSARSSCPAAAVRNCGHLLPCNVGKSPPTPFVALSQPFWLKVHTALVHSCNSVSCPWLSNEDVANADRPPQEAAAWDCAGSVAEPGPRESVVQMCTTGDSQREAARGENAGSFQQNHGTKRMPCRKSSWTMSDANTMACPRR